jgi:prolyl-tRNA synthetase
MPFYTTHGITQRIIGDLIVVHGDDNGLVLPFKIAQKQVIISPLFADRDKNVLVKANEIKQLLQDNGINCFIDDSDKSFGFKINNSEVLGTPFFIAFGPVDLNKNECILIRRDNHIKQTISLDKILSSIKEQALVYDKTLYDNSLNRLKDSIVVCDTMEECKKAINEQKIVLAPFAGSVEDEDKFKQLTQAKPRCILDKENFYLVKEKIKSIIPQNKKCIISNNPAKHYVFFGRQY